jgi:solute carrier family 25 carnitine/acylcarnitine transporter 20/29
MHTSVCLHCVLSIAFLPLFSFAGQVPLSPESVTSKTLVDVLNADPDYTSLLRLLQRTRLIPTLNKLNGSTLFAPTNEAVKEHASRNTLWQIGLDGSTSDLTDNVQEQLRQQLFYHLLNESLLSLPPAEKVEFYKTLLYPQKPLDQPSRDPPFPPWMPIQNGTLGSEPQRLRLAKFEDTVSVSVDAFGKGGVKIVKDVQDGGNGIVIGINKIIVPPADLGK